MAKNTINESLNLYDYANQLRDRTYKDTMALSGVPYVDAADLTPKSSLTDAFHAFIHSDYVQSKIEAGSHRAHEPYVSLARLLSHVTIEQGASRPFAATFRDKDLKKLAGNTRNVILSKMTNLYTWLIDYGLVKENPWCEIARAPVTKKRRATRKLTQEEIDGLLDYLDNINHRRTNVPATIYGDIFRLSLLTAMRYNEVMNLTLGDYSRENRTIHIDEWLAKTGMERQVFLSDAAIEILERYKPSEEGQRFFPINYGSVARAINRYSHRVGVPFHFHLARHTAISRYAEKTMSINELRAFSGHKSVKAASVYMHVDTEHLKETVLAKLNG